MVQRRDNPNWEKHFNKKRKRRSSDCSSFPFACCFPPRIWGMLNAKTMQAERYIYVSRPPDLRDRTRTLAPCRALEDPEVHELADQPKVEWSYLSTVSQEPRYHHTNWIPWKIWKSVYRIWGEASTSKSHKVNKRQKKRRIEFLKNWSKQEHKPCHSPVATLSWPFWNLHL